MIKEIMSVYRDAAIISAGVIMTYLGIRTYDEIKRRIKEKEKTHHELIQCNDSDYLHLPECSSIYEHNYSPLPRDLIEYIKEQNKQVFEICAGDGDNKEKLEEEGIKVEAYDMFPNENKGVKAGTNGTFDIDPEAILMCNCGFNIEPAVAKYKGNMLIIGSVGKFIPLQCREVIANLSDPVGSYLSTKVDNGTDQAVSIDARIPKHFLEEQGFKLSKVFFNRHSKNGRWNDAFLVYCVWTR